MKIGRVLGGLFCVMVLFIIFGERGFMDYRSLREKQITLEEANTCLIKENSELKREVTLLRSDARYIETVARRELGMVRPGDRVYQFID